MKTLLYLGLLFFGIFLTNPTKASHVMGGNISWDAIGNDSFKVLLTVYRDCNSIDQDSTEITLRTKCLTRKVKMYLIAKTDITPLCANECSRCSDPKCSFMYGIEKIELVGIFSTSDFINKGCCEINLTWSNCCRSVPLNPSNQFFYLMAKMNACLSNGNSSPRLSGEPLSLLCLNQDQVYSYSFFDNDADSLRYSLTAPLKDSVNSITYPSGYSYTKPITYKDFPRTGLKFPSGFHFDEETGLIMFRPTKVEVGIVAFKVFEYKKGKIISEITHEMIVIVIKCPSNAPPVLSGLACRNPSPQFFEKEICPNEKFETTICTSDGDKDDTVKIKWYSEIPNASFSVTNPGYMREQGLFSWTPKLEDVREEPYTFTVEAFDNACPLMGITTQVYAIRVKQAGPAVNIDTAIGNCGQLFIAAQTKDSSYSKNFTWNIENQEITHTGGISDTLIFKTKENGKIPFSLTTLGNNACKNIYIDTLLVQNHLAIKTINDTTVCAGSTFNIAATSVGYATCCKQKIEWSTSDTASGVHSIIKFTAGISDTSIWVTSSDGLCIDSAFARIFIRQLPKVSLPDSQFFCLGNSSIIKPLYFLDTNIAHYSLAFEWRKNSMDTIIAHDTALMADLPGSYKLKVIDDLGCYISDSIMLTENKSWIPKDTFSCGVDAIIIELPNIVGITYKWQDISNDSTTSFIGYKRAISSSKNRYFKILSIENTGKSQCQSLDSFKLSIALKPLVLTSPSIINVCPGGSTTFKANTAGGKWKGLGVAANTQELTIRADSTSIGQNLYTYTLTNAKGCTGADTSILWIWAKPKAIISTTDTVVKLGSTYVFTNKSKNTQHVVATWISNNPDSILLEKDSIALEFKSLGNAQVKLIVLDTLTHCGDSAVVKFRVEKYVSTRIIKANNLKVYPNPTSGTIHINGLENPLMVKLFNTNGQLVLQKQYTIKENTVSLAELPYGLYFYRISGLEVSAEGKIVLMK